MNKTKEEIEAYNSGLETAISIIKEYNINDGLFESIICALESSKKIKLERQISKNNPIEYNNLLEEMFNCNCLECQQTASMHRHKIIQKLAEIENVYE